MGLLTLFRSRASRAGSAEPGGPAGGEGAGEDHLAAGVALMQQGVYERALEEFRLAAAGEESDRAAAFYNMGQIHDHRCLYKKSAECYERALRADPDLAEAHSRLGLAQSRMGMSLDAVRSCLQAIRLDPSYVEGYDNLATAYFNMGCYPEAVKACDKALALDPSYAPAHYTLGLVYLDLKDKTRAAEQHRVLKNFDPVLSEHLYHLINR